MDADIGSIVAAAAPRSVEVLHFVDPSKEVNGGIWTLFVAASAFLGLRLWCKVSRRAAIWWDDYMLIASWVSYPPPPPGHGPFTRRSITDDHDS